jgi:hypothetical protein
LSAIAACVKEDGDLPSRRPCWRTEGDDGDACVCVYFSVVFVVAVDSVYTAAPATRRDASHCADFV